MNDFRSVPPALTCAWCKTLLRPGALPESHGICEPCRKLQFPDAPGWHLIPPPILLLIPTVLLALEKAIEAVV